MVQWFDAFCWQGVGGSFQNNRDDMYITLGRQKSGLNTCNTHGNGVLACGSWFSGRSGGSGFSRGTRLSPRCKRSGRSSWSLITCTTRHIVTLRVFVGTNGQACGFRNAVSSEWQWQILAGILSFPPRRATSDICGLIIVLLQLEM